MMEPGVKQEGWNFCQCCLMEENEASADMLRNLAAPIDDTRNTYSDLLTACYSIQLITNEDFDDNQYYICITCIERLKESYLFRCQIEDNQIKLKNLLSKLDEGRVPKATESKTSFASENLFKCEFPSDDDDLNPDFDSIDIPEYSLKQEKKNKIIIRSRKASKRDKSEVKNSSRKKSVVEKTSDDIEVTSENAYDVAVQNLLNTEDINSTERKRNKVKIMSNNDFKSYRRLYYRIRYAKAIPFKLEETALSCDICGESFNIHKQLVSHMSIHYPNHICDLCGKSFVLKEQLTGHMRTHSTEKRTCQVCHKILKKSSMTRHMRTHSGNNEVYTCPSCPERFVSFSTRINHMAEKHNIDIFKYSCTICSKKFHLSSSLSKHVRRCHFQELNVSCPECGKGFFDKKSLKNHMLIHTKEKKYQCEVCLKTYGRKYTIREHMKIHNNVKQHKCPVCDKAFTQKCTLKGHLKVHDKSIQDIKCEEF